MTLTRDHLRRLIEVAHAQKMGFVELVGLAELNPAKAFRGVVAQNIDMRGQDLAGFDFTDATFIGCDFRGADLSRAKGVTPEMLADSLHDDTTQLPLSFRDAFWPSNHTHSWAENWGHDIHGRWVTFRVPGTEVTQRMRWISPGQFMMGSPEEEFNRFDNEGPIHLVTIAQGFWMFDTACREALWTAVMNMPPRRPRGPAFPVTDISWNESQDFMSHLNAMLPDLAICLPSEAQWEYACRSDTKTTYSFGISITQKQACYESSLPVAVGSLPPNQWGLYEMHGNIWEWCEDRWHENYIGAPSNGAAWIANGRGGRIFRGGASYSGLRAIRAAYRNKRVPDARDVNLGFRCVRGQFTGQVERQPGVSGPGARR